MAEGRNSRKRPLDIEISQLIPRLQKLRISNEETTVCVDNSSDMVDMDASNQEETLVCVPDATSGPIQTIPKPIQLDNHVSSSSCIASSSTASRRCKYDVFLSFRGPDTRKGITFDIYDGLTRRGIKTFMDNPHLEVGDAISSTLKAAIRESRFAIVVLSQNYAASSWCLEELTEICRIMEDNRVWPLFFEVEPSDVRHQQNSFEKALADLQISGNHGPDKVDRWKLVLQKVAGFTGWNTRNYKAYKELVNVIVEFVCSKVVPDASESIDDFETFAATRQAMDELLQALRDKYVTYIGVYGMGGVGKTTLVEHVGAQAQKSGIFYYVVKCVVSQNPDFKKLQDAIAEQLGLTLHEKEEIGRAARLRKELNRKEKVLIILDDIWERIDLSKVGIPTYMNLRKCNSKILLTTRISHVCYVMECQQTINLNTLSEEDSWALFKRKARRSFETSTFEGVAMKVAGECKGLPISLIAVARALGDKDLAEWMRAAQRLENSKIVNPDDKGEAFKCIKLSYDYLKDEECKSFFLLCCLFPEDYNIRIDQVFMYGMGIGLFQDAETLKEGKDRAHSLAMHLIYSSMLLDGGYDEYVWLHDVVRDAGVRIAESERNFFVKAGRGLRHWPDRISKDCTAISLMKNDIRKLPEDLVCLKLQILLLNGNNYIEEIPETFFQNPNELRVLDLAQTSSLSLLPQSISLVTNLTFLNLLGCGSNLKIDTSILGKLKKLEILYLSDISGELSIELGGLTYLRIFSCNDRSIQRIPPGVISKWKNLEELHMTGFGRWGRKVRGEETKNAGFEEVTSLPKLRVLEATVFDIKSLPEHVDLVPQWAQFNITIGAISHRYNSLLRGKSIVLALDNISDLPDWFRDGLMQRAESLSWKGCKNISDIFVDLEHGRLSKLKRMYLERGKRRYSSVDDIGESFSHDESHRNPIRIPLLQNLEEMFLTGLDCDKSLEAVQTLPPGSLLNLKKLYLHDCYADGNALISLAKLQILSNLEEIRIRSTSNIYIFRHDELFVSLQLNIRSIRLSGCSIIGICEGHAPPTIFQNLQSLDISYCEKLEGSLFTHEVAQCLPQLGSLELSGCTLLERIVEAGNNKTILPKLRKLHLWGCLVLYSESGSLDIECPSLETFYSLNCPKFAASFDDFNSGKQQKPYSWWDEQRKSFKHYVSPTSLSWIINDCEVNGIRMPECMVQQVGGWEELMGEVKCG